MGMSLKEFNSMTLAEFYYKQEGFNRRIKREFESTRLIAYMIHLSTPLKKHESFDKFLKEQEAGISDDFLKHYWERKKQLQEQEQEILKNNPDYKFR